MTEKQDPELVEDEETETTTVPEFQLPEYDPTDFEVEEFEEEDEDDG